VARDSFDEDEDDEEAEDAEVEEEEEMPPGKYRNALIEKYHVSFWPYLKLSFNIFSYIRAVIYSAVMILKHTLLVLILG